MEAIRRPAAKTLLMVLIVVAAIQWPAAAGAVLVVLLLPALTFRWTGRWSCPVYIRAEATRARDSRELVKAGDGR